MKERNSIFELLKVIAILFICFSSALPYGAMFQGAYENIYVNLDHVKVGGGVLLTLFRYLGQVGDALFLVCSAWFLCESRKAKSSKYLKLIFDSFFISIAGLLIASAFMHPSLKEILKSLFPITFQNNWFVGCYIIYYLIHPLLNSAISGFDKKHFTVFVTVVFIVYSVIATVYPSYYFTNLVAFIMIHYIVSYFKKYELWKHDNKYDVLGLVIFWGLLFLSIIGVRFLGNGVSLFEDKNLWLCHFYNPVIVGIALSSLFLAAKHKMKSRIINGLSSLSLFIYLIHGNFFWQAYGKYAVLGKIVETGMSVTEAVFLLFCGIVIASIAISKIYTVTVGKVANKLADKLSISFERFMQ